MIGLILVLAGDLIRFSSEIKYFETQQQTQQLTPEIKVLLGIGLSLKNAWEIMVCVLLVYSVCLINQEVQKSIKNAISICSLTTLCVSYIAYVVSCIFIDFSILSKFIDAGDEVALASLILFFIS